MTQQDKLNGQSLNARQQQLVAQHMELAFKLAQKYRNCGLDMDDIVQESYLGLCEAAMRYDETTGCQFMTYAYLWCRKKIIEAIYGYSAPIKLGGHEAERPLFLSFDVEYILEDEENDDDSSLLATLNRDEEQEVQKADLIERLSRAVDGLDSRDRFIITKLYGLDDEPMSNGQLARYLCVSPARISTIAKSTLGKLRKTLP